MRHFDLPKTLLLALYVSSVDAVARDGHRILRAAMRRSDILKRDTRIVQKFESEVVYIEDNGRQTEKTFASAVKVSSKKPILYLEEIEHLLQDVRCQGGRLMLHFVDAGSARDARAACLGGHGGTGGLIITSHQSCNRDGERAVYKIDDISFTEEGIALDLAVTEALWQDAFDHLDINFGPTQYDHVYRRHSDFERARRKRQDEMTVDVPSIALGNVTDVTFELSSELLNYTFTANDFLPGRDSIVNLPLIPDLPLEIGCKNCSTRGQIVLTQGAISIDTRQIDLVPDIFEGGDDGKEIHNIITGGYMELIATGMGARLEMFARPVKSGSYEIALVPLPILGFVIPGIGQAGASFEAKIVANFETEEELVINYGIDVNIPNDAGIKVQLGDITNTTITGIKGATLDTLPFSSNVTDTDLALSLAFAPTIPIGFEFSDKLSALVTVSLHLPRLDTKLTNRAKDQCSLLVQGKKPELEDAELSKLVLVEANVSVVIDVAAELTLPLLPAPFDSASTLANIFSTQMPLVKSCVNPVEGILKITEMVPVATIKADAAIAQVSTTPACTKHEVSKPCTCAIVTTTVYAASTTGGWIGSSPRVTAPPLDTISYYPAAPTNPKSDPGTPIETPTGENEYGPVEHPRTSTPCTNSQTLRITVSTTPASTPEALVPPPIVTIPAPRSKPCNSSTSEIPSISTTSTLTPIVTTSRMEDGHFEPSSTIIQTSESGMRVETKSEATSKLSATLPPKVEESKGFMSPLHSETSGDVVTPTGSTEFTGAAMPGVPVPQLRGKIGWQIAMLAAGMGFGVLLI